MFLLADSWARSASYKIHISIIALFKASVIVRRYMSGDSQWVLAGLCYNPAGLVLKHG